MPRILAHRGQPSDENTLKAFQLALEAGADIIETDIQCTSDGVPVVFHDDDLVRISGFKEKVAELSLLQLRKLNPNIPTLEEALLAFPNTKFNIDFKADAAISPAIAVIHRLGASQRVLATSFSGRRVAKVHRLNANLVRSLPANRVLLIYLFRFLARPLSRGFVAAQIPVKSGFLEVATKRFIKTLKRQKLEVHFWVVNELQLVDRLLALGADGFVTDETAKLVAHLRKA